MKLWRSLKGTDQPKPKPKTKNTGWRQRHGSVWRDQTERKRNKPKQRKVGLEWEPKEAPLLLFGEKKRHQTLNGPLFYRHHHHDAPLQPT